MSLLFQYVLSGSDDFNLYMWAIPDDLSESEYFKTQHFSYKKVLFLNKFCIYSFIIFLRPWEEVKLFLKCKDSKQGGPSTPSWQKYYVFSGEFVKI